MFYAGLVTCSFSSIVQCRKGWYGVDCSVPSYLPPPVQRPKWLPQEAAPDVSDETNRISVASNIMKKRPLVYVYDLPAEFTTQFLQVDIHLSSSYTCVDITTI